MVRMKRLAIIQSNYIPWKGYFDLIGEVDEFLICDELQYTKNDWRNRNKIKTPNGMEWITIPVRVNSSHQKINETRVADNLWAAKHLKAIKLNYSKAPCFKHCEDWLSGLYGQLQNEQLLSNINYTFIVEICKMLNIKTKITLSTEIGRAS